MELIKRLFGIGYSESENKDIYQKIASEHNISAIKVYRIAHGKRPASSTEKKVFDRLRAENIIKRK